MNFYIPLTFNHTCEYLITFVILNHILIIYNAKTTGWWYGYLQYVKGMFCKHVRLLRFVYLHVFSVIGYCKMMVTFLLVPPIWKFFDFTMTGFKQLY